MRAATDAAEYARQIEAYLCRKNGGHLVRVVGPAFEMVCGWAERGLPLKVAFRGIDRCCERRDARDGRGARRRPLRIEFCEADVLEAFDDWRRAVGVHAAGEAEEHAEEPTPRKPALSAHIDRVIARLAFARGVDAPSTDLHRRIDAIVAELEGLVVQAARVRGDARAALVSRLEALDAALVQAAVAHLDEDLSLIHISEPTRPY